MLATQVEVVYESREAQCLIDLSQNVDEIVRTLCLDQLALPGDPSRYALRLASTLELITDENIRRKVSYGERIRLVVSPQAEAREMAKQLQANAATDRKKLIFTLKEAIKASGQLENEFAVEFVRNGGLHTIMDIVRSTTGNSLAYALSSLVNLMEHDFGWELITDDFIHVLARLVVHETLVNICRPAIAALIKLVCADSTSIGQIQCYGYEKLHQTIMNEPEFLPCLVGRLGSSDYVLAQLSLALINSISIHVTPEYTDWFQAALDGLGVRRSVMRLMQLNPGEEMGKRLLDFQQIVLRRQHQLKHTPIGAEIAATRELLDGIWQAARIGDADRQVATRNTNWTGEVKWRLLGFDTENPWKEMHRVGLLGLQMMHHYVISDADHFTKLIMEQLNRASNRRCPFARASIEVTELLSDLWNIGSGYAPATAFQPLQLMMADVHNTTILAFFRGWNHMEATTEDFDKVSALIRSHVRYTIHESGITSLFDFERAMLETPYETMRARQLKDLEEEDDLLTKLAVRNLRERLYRESFEFVKQQRIDCLVRGAWFPSSLSVAATPSSGHAAGNTNASGGVTAGGSSSGVLGAVTSTPIAGTQAHAGTASSTTHHGKSRKPTYRYYRLSPNKKYLHYGEFTEMSEERPTLDDLPEKIDLSLVTHVVTGSVGHRGSTPGVSGGGASGGYSASGNGSGMAGNPAASPPLGAAGSPLQQAQRADRRHPHQHSGSVSLSMAGNKPSHAGTASGRFAAPLTFSLMTGNDTSLVDFVAPDATRYAEWTDGFNMLLDRNIANRDTADLIMSLTEVVTRVHLLDVAAEKLDIPGWCELPAQPPDTFDFYYGEIS